MEKTKYKNIVDKNTPKENTFYDCLVAFVTGGLMGVLAEILIEFYQNLLDIPFKKRDSLYACNPHNPKLPIYLLWFLRQMGKLLQMWSYNSNHWLCSRNYECSS